MIHIPVMKTEVLEALNPQPGEFFVDGTLGGGGHAELICERIKKAGRLLVIDVDVKAIENFRSNVKCQMSNVTAVRDNFKNLPDILAREKLGKADGFLLDLGLSSDELTASGRGFSFQVNEPLFMTLEDDTVPVMAILRTHSEEQLAEIIKKYGEERYANRIAGEIKNTLRRKPIETTFDLRDAVLRATPRAKRRGNIHPATRTFMALRIYANHEYENLASALRALPRIVKDGGRVAVITFHSGEDRIVKNIFRDFARAGTLLLINKKVIVPTREEVRENPRARSAKLRAAVIGVKQSGVSGGAFAVRPASILYSHY
ncbi:MAG: 16S rRNA (cytosine(1402)-N(4))-methyltransferase RsmH [Candidatus Harrisonbacteria bacterium]|nr:16S rRNA (cytosine(1402)-N(4))-methyltransferase RsmH [Candidatus Harrisonbacteria bacterium]MBI2603980.1 16S rRNA (cytosine(1402)-N(4))-methyltransferase RsmH [Candidatus Harrisonbacteria bacterium]